MTSLRTILLTCFVLFLGKMAHATQDSIVKLAMILEYDYPDSAIFIAETRIASGQLDEKTIGDAYEIIGIANWVREDYGQAIVAHQKALDIRQSIEYGSGVAHSYNNLGLNYQRLGDAKLAMKRFLSAQEMAEEQGDSLLLAKVLGNIGTLYEEEGAVQNALEFYGRSLAILESGGNQRVLGNTLNNIAVVYKQIGETERARNFSQRSLAIRKLIDDRWGIAQTLNFMGLLASANGELSVADSLFRESLAVYTELDNHWGKSMVYGNLGADANAVGNYRKGLEYCGLSLSIAKEYWLEWEGSACRCLAESYTGLENSDEASYYWKRLVAIKDSIRNENSLSEISLIQKRFEFEKEQLKAQHEQEKKDAIAEEQLHKREVYLAAATGFTFLLGIISLILFFFYRVRTNANVALEKKNNEISSQKAVIEKKNLHITDSIRYAERLQAAILPKDEMFTKYFSDFNILYKPKDIVSGDFYWMESLPLAPSQGGGTISYLAVADCTGHGVPGAMVSMVGFQGLNKAVLEEKLTSPAAILQRLSDHVEEAFEKSGGSVKDGMDICLVAIDTKKRAVTYSGAHNALWILTSKEELPNANLREEQNGYRMFELKADRRSIGGFMDAGKFTETTVELNEGDRLFLFSDGFADQFGGPQGKKLGSKRMRETVREMALSGNLVALGAIFEDWKGKEEQIDDVTVIAVSV